MPDVGEHGLGIVAQKRAQAPVVLPGALDGGCVDLPGFLFERRNKRLYFVQPNIPLRLLLGVVKGMRVQKAPDKLPTVWCPPSKVAAPMLTRCLSVISSGEMMVGE
jgi:hypothetical protein